MSKNLQCHCWTKGGMDRCKNKGIHKVGSVKLCDSCYEFVEKLDPKFMKEYGKKKIPQQQRGEIRI